MDVDGSVDGSVDGDVDYRHRQISVDMKRYDLQHKSYEKSTNYEKSIGDVSPVSLRQCFRH